AIDLTLPILVSYNFLKEDVIPVLVTSDVRLFTLFNSMKIKCIVRGGIITPPLLEIDLNQIPWKEKDIKLVDSYFNSIQKSRRERLYCDNREVEDIIIKNMNLCKNLEDEAKRYM
ncbi:MAG: hypothetical protein ACRDA5_05745, partial [Clostridium sp.]